MAKVTFLRNLKLSLGLSLWPGIHRPAFAPPKHSCKLAREMKVVDNTADGKELLLRNGLSHFRSLSMEVSLFWSF